MHKAIARACGLLLPARGRHRGRDVTAPDRAPAAGADALHWFLLGYESGQWIERVRSEREASGHLGQPFS